ncbi:MAG: hypothetical protein JWP29_2573 [Rhodoferax sp.]|nr:hypothetical protein [Rhodoferax sp.]
MPTLQRRSLLLMAALATGLASLCGAASAQTAYPTRPIRLIVPFVAGGGSDSFARILAEPLGRRLGQPVVIENKPGAASSLAAEYVARAQPDGYTLMYGSPGAQMINPYLMKLNYSNEKDFAPISKLGVFPNVLVVNARLPVNSVPELIAWAKAHPGKLNFGSTGIGSTSHLSGELFKTMAGVDIVHVPYKGTAAVVQDLVAGNIEMAIDAVSTYLPYIKAGSLRALAIGTPERTPVLPELAPVADTLPGFNASALNYVSAPAGTPAPVVEQLNREINAVLAMPEVRARLLAMGVAPQGSTPGELDTTIRAEAQKWKKVIEISGAKAE